HLVNVLLHAGATALVAELARRVTSSSAIALIAGLLFAGHPIHVEAVANIVGRAELMCGVGVFAAIVLFLHPASGVRSFASWAWFVFAMLSKEQGMLVPLMLLIAIPTRPQPVGNEPPVITRSDDPPDGPAPLAYASGSAWRPPRFRRPDQ